MAVLRIAHRGGAALKPENTLSAFADAIARGLDGAELDVQLTRDGNAVVFHDFRLKPDICRNERGDWQKSPAPKIVDIDLAELEKFDVGRTRPGSDYANKHPLLEPSDGERIPLLAEVVELVRHAPKTFRLFIEIKSSFADPTLSASAEAIAEAAYSIVSGMDYLENCVFVGFDWRGLRRIKDLAPGAQCWFTTLAQSWFGESAPPPQDDPPAEPALRMLRHWSQTGTSPWAAGYDAVRYGDSILAAIKAAGGDGWFPFFRDADRDTIAEAHDRGLKVGAWTVDDPASMRTLIENGIDALCTDRTDLIMDM
jgi:glycerophosphoryl diester phosphodiesterase